MAPLGCQALVVSQKELHEPLAVEQDEVGVVLLHVSGVVGETAKGHHHPFLWPVQQPAELLHRGATHGSRSAFALNLEQRRLDAQWIRMGDDINAQVVSARCTVAV